MKTKIAIAVSSAIVTMSASALAAQSDYNQQITQLNNSGSARANIAVVDSKSAAYSQNQVVRKNAVFTPEANLDSGVYRYFVRLIESPVALYQGGIEGFCREGLSLVENHIGNLPTRLCILVGAMQTIVLALNRPDFEEVELLEVARIPIDLA